MGISLGIKLVVLGEVGIDQLCIDCIIHFSPNLPNKENSKPQKYGNNNIRVYKGFQY